MLGHEPIPAALRVFASGLLRIQHVGAVTLRYLIEAGARGEVGGRLRAAVQRDEQRRRSAGRP